MRRARGIIRHWSFDQASFHLIMNIYIHTLDHVLDFVTICCSLLLQSQSYSCQEPAVLYSVHNRPLTPSGDDSFKLQLVAPTLVSGVEQQLCPNRDRTSKVRTVKTVNYIKKGNASFGICLSFDCNLVDVDART